MRSSGSSKQIDNFMDDFDTQQAVNDETVGRSDRQIEDGAIQQLTSQQRSISQRPQRPQTSSP